ncbi:MAG: tail fiber domain-containing protein [Chitinophagaceae bacterium]|nr:tail fiber domain-containing protein [Chitinophagaceae bacterium]
MKKLLILLCSNLLFAFAYAQPANDNSCGAVTIPVENLGCEPTVTYSYTGATWSSGSANTWCENFQNLDVWYKFIIPANGKAIVKIDATDGNAYTAEMYTSNTCNSLAVFNSFTNGYPCLYTNVSTENTREFVGLTPGGEVYMRVYRRFANTAAFANGAIKICVSNNNVLADDPCSAGFFPVDPQDPLGQDCVPVTFYNWTGATLTASIPNPSCISPMPASNVRDVWFKLRVPASGKLRINHTYNGTALVAYTATACNGTFTELACTFFGINWTTLTPNSIVYIRMMRYTGTGSPLDNGSAKICAAESNQVPTANNNTGRVGIGIDTPFSKLDVVGNGLFRSTLTTLGNLETRGDLIVTGNILSKYGNTKLPNNTSVGGQLSLDSLSFSNRLGNRLSLYGGLGNTPQYGFGVQSGLLQMYSDGSNTSIGLGYGNSYNFIERARTINNGEVAFQTNGRLQIKTGSQTAGLWLSNAANSSNSAFIGMANDNQVGFYGNTGALFGLTMNTTTGNVGIGLNGATAQVPLQFSNALGLTKISLYRGTYGDVGIGAYGGELRLQNDIPNGKISMGVIETTGAYTELAKAERNGAYAFSIFGSLWVNGTTYASDERFKQNITPITSPLQKLMQINGVEYEMKKMHLQK